MRIFKDNKALKVTGKAYRVVYKSLGYSPYEEEIEEGEVEEIKPYKEMTKDEIIEKLVGKNIEHNPRDKKEILYDLLIEGE